MPAFIKIIACSLTFGLMCPLIGLCSPANVLLQQPTCLCFFFIIFYFVAVDAQGHMTGHQDRNLFFFFFCFVMLTTVGSF